MRVRFIHILPYVIIALLLWYIHSLNRLGAEYYTLPPIASQKVVTSPQPIVKTRQVLTTSGIQVIEVPNKVNDSLLKVYEAAKDSLEQLRLYKEAITEREYVETLEDTIQTITVESKVIGTLTEQKISYKTKTITLERSPRREALSVYGGMFATLPSNLIDPRPAIGADLTIKLRRTMYKVGYDTSGRVHAGIAFKIL